MNDLAVNQVLRAMGSKQLYRILWISSDRNSLFLFNLDANTMPSLATCEELSNQINDGTIDVLDSDPFAAALSEADIDAKDRAFRDSIWRLISGIVQEEPGIYERNVRGKIVAAAMNQTGKPMASLHRYLKLYWRHGKTKNAFLPNYKNSGGRGQERAAGETKRGRPRKYGESDGKNVDEATKQIFEQAIKKYYLNREEHTLTDTYNLMIKEHYTKFTPQKDGSTKAECFGENEIPSIGQFWYWYSKKYGTKEKLIARKGRAKFELNHRAILGKSDYGIMGPGAKYQIDATIGDIYLVSRFNRAEIIGRPVIYFLIDMFSRMITGMYVGLEGPSWAGSMMALANAASDKVKYCAEYGVKITDSEWPCRHMPNAILADRGEMESKSIETLINALNVRVENAPPFRADMKPIVERYFRVINDTTIAFLPGHVKADMSERGGHDYRLDAIMDIKQLTRILIQCVLYHNNQHFEEKYERSTDMVKDDVPPIPINMWNWGIANISGVLRSFPEETVKLCLMPTGAAAVTAKGIHFKGLYYLCERAAKEQWFETARAKGSYNVDISYDPRNMDTIYIRNADGAFDKCFLAEWQDKYIDRRLEEIEFLHETEKLERARHNVDELAAKAELSTAIDNVIKEAENMARQTAVPESKSLRVKAMRENRSQEKELNRHDESFILHGDETLAADIEQSAVNSERLDNDIPVSPILAMIKKQLEERLNGV